MWGYFIIMTTFINHVYYHWETETQKTHCVDLPHMSHRLQTSCLHTTMCAVSSPWRHFQVSVEEDVLFFRDVNLRNRHLEEMSALWVKNKWTVSYDSKTKLPASGGFCKIPRLCSPPVGQEIMCFLECYCHCYRKADEKTLLSSFQWILQLT